MAKIAEKWSLKRHVARRYRFVGEEGNYQVQVSVNGSDWQVLTAPELTYETLAGCRYAVLCDLSN